MYVYRCLSRWWPGCGNVVCVLLSKAHGTGQGPGGSGTAVHIATLTGHPLCASMLRDCLGGTNNIGFFGLNFRNLKFCCRDMVEPFHPVVLSNLASRHSSFTSKMAPHWWFQLTLKDLLDESSQRLFHSYVTLPVALRMQLYPELQEEKPAEFLPCIHCRITKSGWINWQLENILSFRSIDRHFSVI